MAAGPSNKPSFSPTRKWSLGFNAVAAVVMVFAVASRNAIVVA